MRAAVLIAGLTCTLALQGYAQRPEWRDTFESRLEVLALLQSVNAEILAGSSATRTLEEWCGEHHMAPEPKIVARRVPAERKEPSFEQLERLAVRDASAVQYRHVELRCGERVLSEADNWYVPGRLTPEMNALLESTDTPFGKAVQALRPYRRTVAVTLLWTPLPHGWEQQRPSRFPSHPNRALAIPQDVFRHRAVLYTADHLPFSEVVETYRSELFAFSRGDGKN